MARTLDPRIEQAKKLYDAGEKLIDIADQLGVPEGTIRSWKKRYWGNATLQKKECNVAKEKKPTKRAEQQVEQLVGMFTDFYADFDPAKAFEMLDALHIARTAKLSTSVLYLIL